MNRRPLPPQGSNSFDELLGIEPAALVVIGEQAPRGFPEIERLCRELAARDAEILRLWARPPIAFGGPLGAIRRETVSRN